MSTLSAVVPSGAHKNISQWNVEDLVAVRPFLGRVRRLFSLQDVSNIGHVEKGTVEYEIYRELGLV